MGALGSTDGRIETQLFSFGRKGCGELIIYILAWGSTKSMSCLSLTRQVSCYLDGVEDLDATIEAPLYNRNSISLLLTFLKSGNVPRYKSTI
jgi:hypothetical protein